MVGELQMKQQLRMQGLSMEFTQMWQQQQQLYQMQHAAYF
jgi:hypothetical protein